MTARWLPLLLLALLGVLSGGEALAQDVPGADLVPSVETVMAEVVDTSDEAAVSTSVRLVILMTALAFVPGMLMLMTPFTRFIIVFSLLRMALGLQQSPPNQVLIALSLILSMVVMQPTLTTLQEDSVDPYLAGEISTTEAFEKGLEPFRDFMMEHAGADEVYTAVELAGVTPADAAVGFTPAELTTPILVTGFVLTELKAAFVIAVQLYIPFLVVDLIVASVLLGMGMMMLPPVVVSLPFKLLVFVLMDGWGLLVAGLVKGFA
ncbi:MAG: flagellar type III secretion system pore protein FliP [Myxococcota bacterium]